MTALSLWVATKSGLWQIIVAGLTLLPGPLAYGVYKTVLATQPLEPLPRFKRIVRVGCHILAALFVLLLLHGAGTRCPVDEDSGYCTDEDWKPPSAAHTRANDMRLAILIFGGMLYAYDRRRRPA